MSHVTKLNMKVRDLDALSEACDELGLEFRRDQKTFAWWGRFEGDSRPPAGRDPAKYGHCQHAIGRKGMKPVMGPSGEWEVGVLPALDGDGYDLMADTFGSAGRNLLASAGQDMGRLKQEYAVATSKRNVARTIGRKGYKVAGREALAGGYVRLRVRGR